MAKILGVKIKYPEGIDQEKGHRKLQEKAMKILANHLVEELPPESIKELIKRLELSKA